MKKALQSVFHRFGYHICRLSSVEESSLGRFFRSLARFGFSPKHIIDVGANRGTWTRTAIPFFPACHFTLIEPQAHLKSHVDDLIAAGYKIRWMSGGVSDRAGEQLLTIARRDDSSSFVTQGPHDGRGQVSVKVWTLNDIVSQSEAPFPELVKIDAEGYDLKVFDGASTLIGKTDVFLIEAAVRARNFENTFAKVVRTMSDAGYDLVDITDLNRSPKHDLLWLCELAFIRRGNGLFDGATTYE